MNKICNSTLNCPAEKIIFFTKNEYTIKKCKKCGFRFTEVKDIGNHLKEVYSDEYFFEGKLGYPNYLDQKDILISHGINYAKIVSKYLQSGKVLDIGAAAGFILKGFEQAGWNCYGVEPNNTMASYGRDILNLDIATGDLESFESNEKFNLVSMIQVIGHLHNLDLSLQKVHKLLEENGYVIVESWNMNSIYAKIMGKFWHEYSPPSVVNWFSDKTITMFFKTHGFHLVGKGLPSKKINIKHGLSLIDETTPNFYFKSYIINLFINKFGKYHFPYPPLDLKWYLFQKK